jgi:hypothetical protein
MPRRTHAELLNVSFTRQRKLREDDDNISGKLIKLALMCQNSKLTDFMRRWPFGFVFDAN